MPGSQAINRGFMLTVRPISAEDLPALNAIYNYYVHTDVLFDVAERSMTQAHAWLDEHRASEHVALVALEDNLVAGWASLSPFNKREAYRVTKEISTYVAPAYHRRGVGTRLTDAVLEVAVASDVHSVIARITTTNSASVAFFSNVGFDHIGVEREVGFKDGHYLDVVIMQKLLATTSR